MKNICGQGRRATIKPQDPIIFSSTTKRSGLKNINPNTSDSSDIERDRDGDRCGKLAATTTHATPQIDETMVTNDTHLDAGVTELGASGRGLVKSFLSQTRFSGSYDQDIEDTMSESLGFCDMCDVHEVQNRTAMKIMIKGPARAYYTGNIKAASTF